jgi:glycosyltransferase involved in cell wall biosynthesis
MTPRRVLIVAPHFPPNRRGGTEEKAVAIAHSLTSRGVGVDIVCIERVERARRTNVTFEDDEYEGLRVRRIHLALGPHEDLRLWFEEPRLRASITRLIDERAPDLVHVLSGYLWGLAPLDAAREAGVASVVTLADFWFFCPTIQLVRGDGTLCPGPEPIECARCLYDARRPMRALDRRAPWFVRGWWTAMAAVPPAGALFGLPARLEKLARRRTRLVDGLNACDAIASNTRFVGDWHASHGVNRARITVVPNAIATPASRLPHLEPPAPPLRFAYLGQIVPIKGVDVLVRAFRRLRLQGHDVRLAIHGNVNASESYVRELEQTSDGDPAITWAGPYAARDVLSILTGAHVVVVPSMWHENAPATILEAFLAGRPVIATRAGGISEIVRDGVDGLLFERGDVSDLERAMKRLLDEPDLLPRLTSGVRPPPGLEDSFMPRLLGLYEQAVATHASRLGRVVA